MRGRLRWLPVFFFFFQAEDGIRDYKVTGVQTCALPICLCGYAQHGQPDLRTRDPDQRVRAWPRGRAPGAERPPLRGDQRDRLRRLESGDRSASAGALLGEGSEREEGLQDSPPARDEAARAQCPASGYGLPARVPERD